MYIENLFVGLVHGVILEGNSQSLPQQSVDDYDNDNTGVCAYINIPVERLMILK